MDRTIWCLVNLVAMKPEHAETVTVVICAYSEHRWSDLLTAVDSVRNQSRPAHEIIVVVDHNQALLNERASRCPA